MSTSRERAAEVRRSESRRRLLIAAGALALFGLAARFGWSYWTIGRFEVSTNDAYVQADNTTVAPRVSGYLSAVLVRDNEPVRAGQVLARIDDRDFRVALAEAKADTEAARAALVARQAALAMQGSVIDAARATVEVDAANQRFAEQDDRRYATLATTGFGTTQNAQRAASRIAAAHAGIAKDAAPLPPPQARSTRCARRSTRRAPRWTATRRRSVRPSSTSATPSSPQPWTAPSATARCVSASTCRPAPSS